MDEYLRNIRESWNKSVDSTSDKLLQIHIYDGKDPYDSIHDELNYYLNFRKAKVLEIGCGNGLILQKIYPYNRNIFGIDISEKMINECKKAFPDIQDHFRVGDAASLDYSDHEFEIVFSNSVFQYFPDIEYTRRVIEQILRICQPGEKVFISDIFNARLKDTYDSHMKWSLAARLKHHTKRVLKTVFGRQYVHFSYNYIEPDFFFKEFGDKAKIYPLLIRAKKPELYRKFRYSVLIEKNSS